MYNLLEKSNEDNNYKTFLRKTFDLINILKIRFYDFDIIYTSDESLNNLRLIYGNVNLHKLRKDNFDLDLNLISKKYKNETIIYIPIEEDITLKFYNYIKKFGTEILSINYRLFLTIACQEIKQIKYFL